MHITEKLTITNRADNLKVVRDFVAHILSLSPQFAVEEAMIVLAIDEAVANVIEHGYSPDETGPIEIEVEIADTTLVTKIRDRARPYDPDSLPTPNIREHVKAGKRNGLGIFLIRKIMDEIHYTRCGEGQNELKLVKKTRLT